METAQPIPQGLFDKLTAAGVVNVGLHFSGGSDEGYLDVTLRYRDDALEGVSPDNEDEIVKSLDEEVEDWADDAYQYSGAGEGVDYGDDIEYDLVNMKVSTSDWYMARTEGDAGEVELEVKPRVG